MERYGPVALVVLGLGLLGSCVVDYSYSMPEAQDTYISDKEHRPGYYTTDCHTDDDGRRKCRERWVPPEWYLVYEDQHGRHMVYVSQGRYHAFKVGQKVFVSYYVGHITGVRYGTNIATDSPTVEKW